MQATHPEKRIYLAGLIDLTARPFCQKWRTELSQKLCDSGYRPVDPMLQADLPESEDELTLQDWEQIVQRDLTLIRTSWAVVACFENFFSNKPLVGTYIEIGYANAKGIPVILLSSYSKARPPAFASCCAHTHAFSHDEVLEALDCLAHSITYINLRAAYAQHFRIYPEVGGDPWEQRIPGQHGYVTTYASEYLLACPSTFEVVKKLRRVLTTAISDCKDSNRLAFHVIEMPKVAAILKLDMLHYIPDKTRRSSESVIPKNFTVPKGCYAPFNRLSHGVVGLVPSARPVEWDRDNGNDGSGDE